MNIVLVHGFLSTNKIFFLMEKKFKKEGIKCFIPTLKPIDARYGLEDLGKKLRDEINYHLGLDSEIILLGFSMGGVVCRFYLQELGGVNRVKKFISISTPHHGSYLAYLYTGKGVKQLRPNSSFLRKLESTELSIEKLNLYSFRTSFDFLIIPNSSSVWDIAENKIYYSPFHSYMLFNPKVIKELIKLIRYNY